MFLLNIVSSVKGLYSSKILAIYYFYSFLYNSLNKYVFVETNLSFSFLISSFNSFKILFLTLFYFIYSFRYSKHSFIISLFCYSYLLFSFAFYIDISILAFLLFYERFLINYNLSFLFFNFYSSNIFSPNICKKKIRFFVNLFYFN